jgi:hypothetical protein
MNCDNNTKMDTTEDECPPQAPLSDTQKQNKNNNGAYTFGGAPTPSTPFGAGAFGAPPPSTPFGAAFGAAQSSQPKISGFGLPIPPNPSGFMGCNLQPPQGMCGGFRPNNPSVNKQINETDKIKMMDELYKKLANIRIQMQNLNKSVDEIYETISKF